MRIVTELSTRLIELTNKQWSIGKRSAEIFERWRERFWMGDDKRLKERLEMFVNLNS